MSWFSDWRDKRRRKETVRRNTAFLNNLGIHGHLTLSCQLRCGNPAFSMYVTEKIPAATGEVFMRERHLGYACLHCGMWTTEWQAEIEQHSNLSTIEAFLVHKS